MLPDLILPSRVNLYCTESGIDSLLRCYNKKHFKNYPYQVEYQYNSRGFRDQEWPENFDQLQDAVWCIGDSFTVGVGSPIENTWPRVVAKTLNARIINVSMDGSSNEWIARRTVDIFNAIKPNRIIVMWSYFHRRESENQSLNDEQRRIEYGIDSLKYETADHENFVKCVNKVNYHAPECVHFIIPSAAANISPARIYDTIQEKWQLLRGPDWPADPPETPDEYWQLPSWVLEEIETVHRCDGYLKELLADMQASQPLHNYLQSSLKYYGGVVPELDKARDSHHFDLLTSQWVAATVECLRPDWIR